MRTGPEMTLQEVLNEQNLDKNGLLFDIIVYFTMVRALKIFLS